MISIYFDERFGSGCGLNTGSISSQISNQTSSLDSPSVLTGFLRRGGSSSSIKMEQKRRIRRTLLHIKKNFTGPSEGGRGARCMCTHSFLGGKIVKVFRFFLI